MDQSEIARELRLLRSELAATRPTPAVSSITVGYGWLHFKRTLRPGRPGQMVRSLLKPFVMRFWRTPAAEITAAVWADHAKKRRREPTRTRKPPKLTTLNLELIRAKQLLTFMVDERMLQFSPLAKAKKFKTKERRETWLTPDQIDQLLEFAHVLRRKRAPLFCALVAAMSETGVRIGEARVIRWDRIALDGTWAMTSAESPKTGQAHVVAFTPWALRLIAQVPRHPRSPYVFASERNGGLSFDASTLRLWFRKVAHASGLDAVVADGDVRLRPHDLRRSFATNADEAGVPVTLIQAGMGHASIKSTTHYLNRRQKLGALEVARIMGGIRMGENRRGPRRVEDSVPVVAENTLSSVTARVS